MKAIDMTNEIQMENYLRKILKLKNGTKKDLDLNRFYESLISIDKGISYLKNKEAQKFKEKIIKYFIDALNVIQIKIGENNTIEMLRFEINSAIKNKIIDADFVLGLYKDLKKMYNPI